MVATDELAVIVLPDTHVARVPRALDAWPGEAGSLVALVVPIPAANMTAVRLLDEQGRPADTDLAGCAAWLSRGSRAGLAEVDPVAGVRRWTTFVDGAVRASLTEQDELWLPHDAEGRPDLDAEPRRTGDGVPEGWRRLRTCLDLGMQQLSSCRFTPVLRALEQIQAHEDAGARAWILASGGKRLHPPAQQGIHRLVG